MLIKDDVYYFEGVCWTHRPLCTQPLMDDASFHPSMGMKIGMNENRFENKNENRNENQTVIISYFSLSSDFLSINS
jgi:hypothetical protein